MKIPNDMWSDEHRTELVKAYYAASCKLPCDRCNRKHSEYHHATVWGENLCHDCYLTDTPCTQCYPGDLGLPICTTPISELESITNNLSSPARSG